MIDDRWRELARAARMRDWDAIDAVIADRKLLGDEVSRSICRGIHDAKRALGDEARMPILAEPNVMTIHDVENPADYKIVGTREGDVRKIVPRAKAA